MKISLEADSCAKQTQTNYKAASPESTTSPQTMQEEVEVIIDETNQYFSTPVNKKKDLVLVTGHKDALLEYQSFFTVECDEIIQLLQQGWSAGKRKLDELDVSIIAAEPPPCYCTPNSVLDDTMNSAKRRRINNPEHDTTFEIGLCSTQRKKSPINRSFICQGLKKSNDLYRLQAAGNAISTKRNLFHISKGRRSEPNLAIRYIQCSTYGLQGDLCPPKTWSAKSEKQTLSVFGKESTLLKDSKTSAFMKRIQDYKCDLALQESPAQPLEFRSFFSAECDNIYKQLKYGVIRTIDDVSAIATELPPNLSSNITFMSEMDNSYSKACSGLGVTQLDLEKINIHSDTDKKNPLSTPLNILHEQNTAGQTEKIPVPNFTEDRPKMCNVVSSDLTQDIGTGVSEANTTHDIVIVPKQVYVPKTTMTMTPLDPVLDTTHDIVNVHSTSVTDITHDIVMTLDVSVADATQVIVSAVDKVKESNTFCNVFLIEDAKENAEQVSGNVSLADATHDIVRMHEEILVEDTKKSNFCNKVSVADLTLDMPTCKKISVEAECLKSSKTTDYMGPSANTKQNDGKIHCIIPKADVPNTKTCIEHCVLNTTQDIVTSKENNPMSVKFRDVSLNKMERDIPPPNAMHNSINVTYVAENIASTHRGYPDNCGILVETGVYNSNAIPTCTTFSLISGTNVVTSLSPIVERNCLEIKTTLTNVAQDYKDKKSDIFMNKIPSCLKKTGQNQKDCLLKKYVAKNIINDTLTVSNTGASPNTQETFLINQEAEESSSAALKDLKTGEITKVVAANSTLLNTAPMNNQDKTEEGIIKGIDLCKESKTSPTNSGCDLDITHIASEESVFCNGSLSFITSTPLPSASNHVFIKKSSGTSVQPNPNLLFSKNQECPKQMVRPKLLRPGLPTRGGPSQIRGPLSHGFQVPCPAKSALPVENSKLSKLTPGLPTLPAPVASSTFLKTPQKSISARNSQMVQYPINRIPPETPSSLPRRNAMAVQNSTYNAANGIPQQRALRSCYRPNKGSAVKFTPQLSAASPFVKPALPMSTSANRTCSLKTPNTFSGTKITARDFKCPLLPTPQAAGLSQIMSSKAKSCVSGLPVRKLQAPINYGNKGPQ